MRTLEEIGGGAVDEAVRGRLVAGVSPTDLFTSGEPDGGPDRARDRDMNWVPIQERG